MDWSRYKAQLTAIPSTVRSWLWEMARTNCLYEPISGKRFVKMQVTPLRSDSKNDDAEISLPNITLRSKASSFFAVSSLSQMAIWPVGTRSAYGKSPCNQSNHCCSLFPSDISFGYRRFKKFLTVDTAQ